MSEPILKITDRDGDAVEVKFTTEGEGDPTDSVLYLNTLPAMGGGVHLTQADVDALAAVLDDFRSRFASVAPPADLAPGTLIFSPVAPVLSRVEAAEKAAEIVRSFPTRGASIVPGPVPSPGAYADATLAVADFLLEES